MTKYILWTFLILALLLVVTHPQGFASAVSSVGGFTVSESKVLGGVNSTTAGVGSAGVSGQAYGFNAANV